jgi:hypothetical protein
MSTAAQFRRELDGLFRRRTQWLRTLFEGRRPGPPLSMGRKHVRSAIASLQDLASDAWAHDLARTEFDRATEFRKSWHPKRGKGRGTDAKRDRFNEWFDEHLGPGPCIYVFWRGRHCVYVGKTGGSGRRISSHFEKHWFASCTRVDVYVVSGRRALTALECLAIHRFQPLRNKFKAERRKWTRRCPLCEVHRDIQSELQAMFRLRTRRMTRSAA